MKEIGEKLKDTRENIGISIDEAAEDLKVSTSQIEAVEAGEMDKFKDVYSVKYFIRDYSKYLGLSYADMVDEFNEYLFDYTSKLSLDDIKRAKKKVKEEPRVCSPYTVERKRSKRIPTFIFIILGVLLALIVVYFVVNYIKDSNKNDDQIIAWIK